MVIADILSILRFKDIFFGDIKYTKSIPRILINVYLVDAVLLMEHNVVVTTKHIEAS